MPVTTDIKLPAIHPFMRMDIPQLLRRVTADHPERPFLIWEPFDGESRQWTYAQAQSDVRRIATTLVAKGLGPGDAVILHLQNSPESVLAWFACAEIGAVAVTTNTRSAGDEFAYYADKVDARGVITQPEYADMVHEHSPPDSWLLVAEPGDGSLLGDSEIEPRAIGPEQPLTIQFTSGTTSRPKGVVWTHANGLWMAMTSARHFQLRGDDIALVFRPLFHTNALGWQMLGSLWVGASVVVQPKFSASRFWPVVERRRCTWSTLGHFVATALKDKPQPAAHHLRFNLLGVSFPNNELFFNIKSIGVYGMTELTSQPVLNDPESFLDKLSMGRPTPEYDIRVAGEDGSQVGYGERGELQIKGVRGLSLFAQYLADPQATAEAFTGDGYFRTGDMVTLREDGALVFSDRLKDMLKVGGENVATSEVEAVIRKVAGVHEVAVVAKPHDMLQEVAYAFVVPAGDAPADLTQAIEEACEEKLADFKRPGGIELVDELPHSMEGKVVKAELRARLAQESGNG